MNLLRMQNSTLSGMLKLRIASTFSAKANEGEHSDLSFIYEYG
jgi:hypothetical protein